MIKTFTRKPWITIQAEYRDVLHHSDVRWLSRGSTLQRIFSLQEEIGLFLTQKGQPMQELAGLALLVDTTKHLNALNVSLQGQDAVVSQLYAHIKCKPSCNISKDTCHRWAQHPHFPALREVMDSFPQDIIGAQTKRYAADIASLTVEFNKRFQDFAAIEKDMLLSTSAAAGTDWAAAWHWGAQPTPAAFSCEPLLAAGQRPVSRNANICKENAELVRLHIFVWADIFSHELQQESPQVRTQWRPPAWHFTHLNHCSQTRPGASLINVAYAQKKAYATLYAHRGIYKKRTWRENVQSSMQTLTHACAHNWGK